MLAIANKNQTNSDDTSDITIKLKVECKTAFKNNPDFVGNFSDKGVILKTTEMLLPSGSTVKDALDLSGLDYVSSYGYVKSITELSEGVFGNDSAWFFSINSAYFVYDALGMQTKIIYSNGDYMTFDHDGRGNVIKTNSYKSTGELESFNIASYNEDNKVVLSTDFTPERKIIYSQMLEYDVLGNIVATHEQRDKVADSSSKAIRYSYDLLNRLVKTDYSELSDGSENEAEALEFIYSEKGYLKRIDIKLSSGSVRKLKSYEYDGFGKVSKMYDYYSFATSAPDRYIDKSYTYDKLDRVVSMSYADSSLPTVSKESYYYTYDKNSNITSVECSRFCLVPSQAASS